jgi:hypothetical protein
MSTTAWNWLENLVYSMMSFDAIEFVKTHKQRIVRMIQTFSDANGHSFHEEYDVPSVHASVALFQEAVEYGPFLVIRELLVLFIRGVISGTNISHGPLNNRHSDASSYALMELINAGIFTSDGQERSYLYEQRGYVSGSFVVNNIPDFRPVLSMFDAIGACYVFSFQGIYTLKTFGDDPVMNLHTPALDYNIVHSLCVTKDGGNFFTNVNLDNDNEQYNLNRHELGHVVVFTVWDPKWPEYDEIQQEPIERRFLHAILTNANAINII